MPEERVAAASGITIDFGQGPAPATGAQVIALLNLLAEHGYHDGHPGEDEESQQFAADVRDLNRGWQPGEIPRVPRGYRSVPRPVPVVHVPERREAAAIVTTRPREHRSRSRTRPTRGSPDDPDPEPPLAEIPPAVFWADVRAWLGAT